MSALPPKADIHHGNRNVRFGPLTDLCTAAKRSIRSPRQQLRIADAEPDPQKRLRLKQYLKQEYANDAMMGEINAKAAVGEYLHAIRQIRDDPNGASARLESFARWSVEMKQALAGVVCCSSPTPSNISNLNSPASVACISGRMPTRSTVAIIGNRFEKFRHCQALSAVARPSWMVLDFCKRRLKARKNKRNREECQ